MPKDTLIRTICGGKVIREYNLRALLGQFFHRLEARYGVAEIADPELTNKLTEEELQQLYAKFPYINPDRPLPPLPVPPALKFREKAAEPVKEVSVVDNELEVVVAETVSAPIEIPKARRGRKPKIA